MFFFLEWLDYLATSKTQFKKAILLGYSIDHGIAQQALLTNTKIYTNLWCKRGVVCYKKYTSVYFYLYGGTENGEIIFQQILQSLYLKQEFKLQ